MRQVNPDGSHLLLLNGGRYHVRKRFPYFFNQTAQHSVREKSPRTAAKAPHAITVRARADSEGGKGVAGQRPAMRNNDGSINYLLGDHLGSVSTVVDSSGQIISQSRYLPFGELLWEDGTSPTDYTYTGQRSLSDIGLIDYNARFYDPMLGRFTSPDSIVYSPKSFNRYDYVNNNPLRYTDPSGHIIEESYNAGAGGSHINYCDQHPVQCAINNTINQYEPAITGKHIPFTKKYLGLGVNACGLVAPANDVDEVTSLGKIAKGNEYTNEEGIQPSGLVDTYKEYFGEENVVPYDDWNVESLSDAVDSGLTVIVDIKVAEVDGEFYPVINSNYLDGSIAHFAEVLDVDEENGTVLLENTLSNDKEPWEISIDGFLYSWENPEKGAGSPASEAEDVTFFGVTIDR